MCSVRLRSWRYRFGQDRQSIELASFPEIQQPRARVDQAECADGLAIAGVQGLAGVKRMKGGPVTSGLS